MPKKTSKSRYESRWGGGRISPAQYITELVCEIVAKQDKKQLYDKFWKNPVWARFFRQQIPAANQLLKEFPPEVVIAALKTKEVSGKIRSLRANWLLRPILEDLVKHKHRLQDNELVKSDTSSKPRKPVPKKNIMKLL